MKLAPLVSVIIPAYNCSDWISDTLESVLNQDYQNIEIIVIDDGSTDNTRNIVCSFGKKVKYFYKINGGQSSARNLGIKYALGKYIAFIDSDDLWVKEKLTLQVELLENNNFKWAYSDGIAFDSSSKAILFRFKEMSRQYDGDILINLFQSCFIPMPSVIINKEVFSNIGYFNEDYNFRNREDWEMWIRIAEVYPVALIPEILVKYRVHQNSVTGSESLIERLNGNILVVKQAALRNPKKLGRYENKVLYNLHYSNALALALSGQQSSAKKIFQRAIRFKPFSPILYISWVLIPIIPWISSIRNKFYSK